MSARRKAPSSWRANGSGPDSRRSGLVVFCTLSDGVLALGVLDFIFNEDIYHLRGGCSILGLNEALLGVQLTCRDCRG